MRIGGIGGMVLSKLGAIPQQIPASDIYSSLEKGTIDAAEWIGPHDDEKLGLNKVAPYYYAPGWFEGSGSITTMVYDKAFESLPPAYKAAFEAASNEQTLKMMAHYDQLNPIALRKLIAGGAKVAIFPKDVMDATYQASQELWKELSEKIRILLRFFQNGPSISKAKPAGSVLRRLLWITIPLERWLAVDSTQAYCFKQSV